MTLTPPPHAGRLPLGAAVGVAVVCGVLMATQSRINGELGRRLGDGFTAAALSFTAGLVIVVVIVALLPSAQRGVVSGMLNLSRNLGLLTGASVLGAVFAAAASTSDLATALPAAVAFGMQASFGVAAALVAAALLVTRAGANSVAQSN